MHSDDLAPEAAGALAVLHARYSDDVHKHVRNLLGDEKAAEDVARAVFARARDELAQGGRVPSSLRSWVLSIAQQEVLRSRQDVGPPPSGAQPNGWPPPSGSKTDGLSRPWKTAERPSSAAPTGERPARAAAPNARASATAACPNLGFADDPANRYSRPTRLHRCFANGHAASVSPEEQRSLCVTAGFAACPRFVAAGSDATATTDSPETEAAEPAKAAAPPVFDTNGHKESAPTRVRPVPERDWRPGFGRRPPPVVATSDLETAAPEPSASALRSETEIEDSSPDEGFAAEAAMLGETPPVVEPAPVREAPVAETGWVSEEPVVEIAPASEAPVAETGLLAETPADNPPPSPERASFDASRSRPRLPAARVALARASSVSTRFWAQIAITLGMLGRAASGLWAWMSPRLRAAAILLGAALKRLVGLSGALLRATITLLLAALAVLVRALRFTGAKLLSIWNALGPPPEEIVGNRRDAEPMASGAQESSVHPRPAPAPAVVSLTDASTDGRFAALAAQGGNGDQVLQALMVLELQGVVVTTVVRDQRGMRVKGIVGGQSTTRWYSLDECARLVARNAVAQPPAVEEEPELVPVERKRRVWPSILLPVVVLVGVLTLMANWAGRFSGVLEAVLR